MCKECNWTINHDQPNQTLIARCDCGNERWVKAWAEFNIVGKILYRCTKCDALKYIT